MHQHGIGLEKDKPLAKRYYDNGLFFKHYVVPILVQKACEGVFPRAGICMEANFSVFALNQILVYIKL